MTIEEIQQLWEEITNGRRFTDNELTFARRILVRSEIDAAQVKGGFDAWVKEDRIPPIQRKHHLKTWNRAAEVAYKVATEPAPVRIDIERLQAALESGTVAVPPGLTIEEMRAFIQRYADSQAGLPEPIDWAAHPETILPAPKS